MTNTGHFDAIDDQTIGIRKFFEKIRFWRLLRPMRLQRLLKLIRLQWFNPIPKRLGHVTLIYGLIPPLPGRNRVKAWKITIEDFRVILVLEFNNLRTKIF